mmetsp:Transcript_46342/g.140587  ORF Transcript_46342/g.140587 Transcript_46342/m.140587 type:complete len:316 (+) Transcript_46342:521-1468(+)
MRPPGTCSSQLPAKRTRRPCASNAICKGSSACPTPTERPAHRSKNGSVAGPGTMAARPNPSRHREACPFSAARNADRSNTQRNGESRRTNVRGRTAAASPHADSTSAPWAKSTLSTCEWPWAAALASASTPWRSRACTTARADKMLCTHATCPASAAPDNTGSPRPAESAALRAKRRSKISTLPNVAATPAGVTAGLRCKSSIDAPHRSKSLAHSACPAMAALWSGDSPLSRCASTSAPRSSKTAMASALSEPAAAVSAVEFRASSWARASKSAWPTAAEPPSHAWIRIRPGGSPGTILASVSARSPSNSCTMSR